MLPLCADQGVGVLPWSPLARGRLTRDRDTVTDPIEELEQPYDPHPIAGH
jgi:aryl-alcohol dehydrogenase-like predicted oxidoreductase